MAFLSISQFNVVIAYLVIKAILSQFADALNITARTIRREFILVKTIL